MATTWACAQEVANTVREPKTAKLRSWTGGFMAGHQHSLSRLLWETAKPSATRAEASAQRSHYTAELPAPVGGYRPSPSVHLEGARSLRILTSHRPWLAAMHPSPAAHRFSSSDPRPLSSAPSATRPPASAGRRRRLSSPRSAG